MKTVLKVGVGLFALLVVGLTVFYFAMLKEPEPAPVCEHIVPILKRDAFTHQQCVEKLEFTALSRSQLEIARYRKCLLKATTSKDIDACSYKGS